MKRLPLILTVTFLILAVGGYFLYSKLFFKKSIGAWNLVPESCVLVYESGNCDDCLEATKQSAVWQIVQRASFYGKQSDSLKTIFKFIGEANHNLISLHVTRKDDFDFVFYVKTKEKQFDVVLEQWKKNRQFKFSQRELNGIKIQEVKYANQVLSWIFIENIWIGSFTSFLIEDVIRTYKLGSSKIFKNVIYDVYQMPKMKKDAGNVYVNLKNFADYLNVFTDSKSLSSIHDFGKSSILDVKATENTFSLNGFSSDSINKSKYVLSLFTDQSPVPFSIKGLISNRTVFLTSYGISDGEIFNRNLQASNTRKSSIKDTLLQISKTLPLDLDKFYKSINGEIGVCFVESKGKQLSKIMLVDTNNSEVWLKSFNEISTQLSIDTIFFEKFSDYEIRELPLYRFPEKAFSPLVSGFDRSYYTSIGNTIIIGEDLEELKKYLEDIDREETWGKSVSQNRFLGSTLLESNISLYVNTSRIWNILSGSTNSKWKKFIADNGSLLQSLGMGAIQFSHLNESFYTNVSWSYQNSGKLVQDKPTNKKIITNFENPISKIFVVKNHTDKSNEVLVQDSLHNLHLISSEGKVLWKITLDDDINSEVEQIDYFSNGKLQYLFSANNKLYVIDRLGNYVNPFPVVISVKDIDHVTVVDYDHSRKYRFLVTTKSGELWMYDKEGVNLDGWKPKNVEGNLTVAPQHHRIRGKDYIISIRKDGKVYLLSRRGETLKNFPIDIDGRPSGDYFLEPGNSMATTYFVIITKEGARVKFNLEGKIQSRETLLKTSGDARFGLVAEQKHKSYLILRQESKQLVLVDEEEKELLRNEYVGLNPVEIEYVDYGAGLIFITITDTLQDLSFVYDGKGNLLTTPPIDSYHCFARASDGGKPKLFSIYQNALTIQVAP